MWGGKKKKEDEKKLVKSPRKHSTEEEDADAFVKSYAPTGRHASHHRAKAAGGSLQLKASKCPSSSLALTNCVFLHPDDAKALELTGYTEAPESNYVSFKNFVYSFKANDEVPKGTIALSSVQRRCVMASLNEDLTVSTWVPPSSDVYLESIKFEVDFLQKQTRGQTFENKTIEDVITREFLHQVFTIDQLLVADVAGVTLKFLVVDLNVVDLKGLDQLGEADVRHDDDKSRSKPNKGILMKKTRVFCVKAAQSLVKISGTEAMGVSTLKFRPDWNFEQMGIGGLDAEFSDIFRRAFASRIFPPALIQKLGIKHVKGILLYGPPGTGKTLMARQIGKMLNGKEPKIVNGPEILNKYVGQSEENIRNLFIDAEKEYADKGDDSELHIIIFDEIDAICPARGTRTGGTGVADTVVNQLLSKIDGVESLNNILVIGMTNRKDMIDEALLRPGRLEVHMEIGLPDEKGRLQIIRIHTNKMRQNNFLGEDVLLEELAEHTKNFSGAEIEGLVKSATSFAFNKQIDATNPTKPLDPTKLKVTKRDFELALNEVKPAFGVATDQFANSAPNGIIPFGEAFGRVMATGKMLTKQVLNSSRTPLVSILFEGSVGCGKTALASELAMHSEFPYVKLISPEDLVSLSEQGKCLKITKCFEDAYKSPLSVIVVDDIERLLDYVGIGPRFSNAVLQTLLVLLKKVPPKGRKMLIIGTTSSKDVLEAMGFTDVFTQTLHVPDVSGGKEVGLVLEDLKVFSQSELSQVEKQFKGTIPVKKLLMLAEMAQQGDDGTLVDRFFECMLESGVGSFHKS